jgi:hypothetical protein
MNSKNKIYTLEKISDDVFKGNHPNYVFAGDLRRGSYYEEPTVGERFHFGTAMDRLHNHLNTSIVLEVLGEGSFKTKNSTYKLIEIL